jgi:DNA processing protein
MDTEALFANAFNHIPELGPIRLRALKNNFGSFENAWKSSYSELAVACGRDAITHTVLEKRKHISPDHLWQTIQKEKMSILLPDTTLYPKRLRTIPVPPQILYVKGTLPPEIMPAVAVVGTRKPTSYGKDVCDTITNDLTRGGVCIVSGLALGIDARAHIACITAHGHTVAVIGSGLQADVLYPASNRKLAERIFSSGGALISEYPPHLTATNWTFPQRNRIIAGIADITLVVEATKKSGTRITANYAVEYNRDVFAVPGPIYSAYSETPHILLKEGAGVATSADDILFVLPGYRPVETLSVASSHHSDIPPASQEILLLLSEPQSLNTLAHATQKPLAELTRIISILELHGLIKNNGSGSYRSV